MRAWVRWLTPWLDERPKGYLFKRSSPLAGEFRSTQSPTSPCRPGRTRKGANRQQQQELLVSVEAQAE
uniref:Uncharacterized protein n=1 Tax=Oryza rufipogon TaxID=4529 RepID=A0A0E0MX87_ORYRU